MKVRRILSVAAGISAVTGSLISASNGQEPIAAQPPVINEIIVTQEAIPVERPASIFDAPLQAAAVQSQSDVRASKQSVAELRQARALYRANQRVARLEHNLWMGHEPLRPRWNSIPMMSSRYTNRRVYVPVYVYPR
ncbi:MAG: hypothetical protein ACR2NZ_16035 [Rubripirellula sp.]